MKRVLALGEVAAWPGPPLILFVGVGTGGSLAHPVFGGWAALLDRPWTLRGVDLPADTPPETYRRLVDAMRHNPAVHGAVVTAHKLRLYRACAADLTPDRAAVLAREVNALTTGGTLAAYARDALSLTRILPGVLGEDAHLLCLGSGGGATALLLALRDEHGVRLTFADTDPHALEALRSVAGRAAVDPARLSFARVRGPRDCDALVAGPPPPDVVVNATGLGKSEPGSPVTGDAAFGPATLAWDFNYRGPLTFLRQAAARGARTADGWDYFVAGWAGALTAIAGVEFTGDLLAGFARAAAPHRPRTEEKP